MIIQGIKLTVSEYFNITGVDLYNLINACICGVSAVLLNTVINHVNFSVYKDYAYTGDVGTGHNLFICIYVPSEYWVNCPNVGECILINCVYMPRCAGLHRIGGGICHFYMLCFKVCVFHK